MFLLIDKNDLYILTDIKKASQRNTDWLFCNDIVFYLRS
ncbi:hypothetical protein MAMP_03154 [Methylophaga aminisulfidivorans MP]|uniref:Uncharacterized protein n=1 Tax=Methylophaga aminisulfidivorans MP TaxID=1026882 RepID=F5SW80_9GAMM|nr:hypothetical protein MAMP_03154 [Methylophaga aminisulfidivorans MP]